MNSAHKALIWTVIATSLMWTACGKEAANKRKPKPGNMGAIPPTLKPDSSEGEPNSGLTGNWLRFKKTENGMEKTVIWDIRVDGSKMAVKVILQCVKDGVKIGGDAQDVSANFIATRYSFIVQKPVNITAKGNSNFKGICNYTETANKYQLNLSNDFLGLKKNGQDAMPDLCKVEKKDDYVTLDSCPTKLRISERQTPPAGQERALDQVDQKILNVKFKSTVETDGDVKVQETVSLSKDSITVLKACTAKVTKEENKDGDVETKIEDVTVEIQLTAKAKITKDTIEILEKKSESKSLGTAKCENTIEEQKIKYSQSAFGNAITLRINGNDKTFRK
jgi:hypothetical protein